MIRKDKSGLTLASGKKFHLRNYLPIDVHVARVARRFGLLKRKQTDWLAAIELTEHLKKFDAKDPVKYDFALLD
jgi:uncharacterized protein (TIGR02757 family)